MSYQLIFVFYLLKHVLPRNEISVGKISTQDAAEQKGAAQQKLARVVNMNLFKIIEYKT